RPAALAGARADPALRPSASRMPVNTGTPLPSRRLGPWLDPLLDLFFPAICPVCEARSDDRHHRPFCGSCWAALPLLAEAGCRVGGRHSPGPPPPPACGGGRGQPPPFDRARAVAAYRDGMRAAIHALKYRGRTAVAGPLAALLAERGARLLGDAGGA